MSTKKEGKAIRSTIEEVVDLAISECRIGQAPSPLKDEAPGKLLLRHYEQTAEVVCTKASNRLGMVVHTRNVYAQVSSMFRAVFGIDPCLSAGIPGCMVRRS